MLAKFNHIAEMIEARLKSGEYSVDGMPGERQIAIEMGVSHMTARRAVQELVSRGLIPRRPAGRLARAETRLRPKADLHVAYVDAAFSSDTQSNWRQAVEEAVQKRNGRVHCFAYFNPWDRAITDALDDEFDGVFLVPPFELSPPLLQRLTRSRHKVVTLFQDLTEHGLPCIDFASPRFIWRIAKHFAELGHRRVDCLNTQPQNPLIRQRIDAWVEAARRYELDTVVHDHAVKPFDRSDEAAHEVAPSIIRNASRPITGLFCTTSAGARGVMRAAHENDVRIGRDLSLASCDNSREARLLVPSLTTLDNPKPRSLIARGLEWIRTGGKNWEGSLKLEPDNVPLWQGESTRPPRGVQGDRPRSSARVDAVKY